VRDGLARALQFDCCTPHTTADAARTVASRKYLVEWLTTFKDIHWYLWAYWLYLAAAPVMSNMSIPAATDAFTLNGRFTRRITSQCYLACVCVCVCVCVNRHSYRQYHSCTVHTRMWQELSDCWYGRTMLGNAMFRGRVRGTALNRDSTLDIAHTLYSCHHTPHACQTPTLLHECFIKTNIRHVTLELLLCLLLLCISGLRSVMPPTNEDWLIDWLIDSTHSFSVTCENITITVDSLGYIFVADSSMGLTWTAVR